MMKIYDLKKEEASETFLFSKVKYGALYINYKNTFLKCDTKKRQLYNYDRIFCNSNLKNKIIKFLLVVLCL